MPPSPSSARLSSISDHLDNKRSREESSGPQAKSVKMSPKSQVPDQLPWDPSCDRFPLFKELPKLPDAPEGAAWVWGDDDQVWNCVIQAIE
jgi:hypothetical protein